MSMRIGENKVTLPQAASLVGSRRTQVPDDRFYTEGDVEGAKSSIVVPSRSLYIPEPRNYQSHNPLLFTLIPGADKDVDRYKDIMKGKARRELLKFKDPSEFIGRRGGKLVSVPVPGINIPRFTRGTNKSGGGGVGQGDGATGTPIGQPQKGDGSKKAGGDPGGHLQEELVPMSRAEIARILKEKLGLPNLKPKGEENVKKEGIKWTTTCRVGTELILQETLKNAIIRNAKERGVDFDLNTVVIEEVDKVFQSWKIYEKPDCNLAIIYMMDVSGSMTDEQKEEVRKISWYLSTIIQLQFGEARAELRNETFSDNDFGEGVREVFLVHDAVAKEVSEEEYYSTRESGGTRISSAYKLGKQIIDNRYPLNSWNVYMFHFSDGDNWGEDNSAAKEIIDALKPEINLFGYIQVESPYGSGEWLKALRSDYGYSDKTVRLAELSPQADSDAYETALKAMLEERK